MVDDAAPDIIFENNGHILWVQFDTGNIAMVSQSQLAQTQLWRYFSPWAILPRVSSVTGVP